MVHPHLADAERPADASEAILTTRNVVSHPLGHQLNHEEFAATVFRVTHNDSVATPNDRSS